MDILSLSPEQIRHILDFCERYAIPLQELNELFDELFDFEVEEPEPVKTRNRSRKERPQNKWRDLREEKGLTRQEVADQTGIGFQTMSNIEMNKNKPSPETEAKLRKFYDIKD